MIMEHIRQIKQSTEGNLASGNCQNVMSALKSESRHCHLACRDSLGDRRKREPVWMKARKEEATQVLCLWNSPQGNKTIAYSTTGSCIFLMRKGGKHAEKVGRVEKRHKNRVCIQRHSGVEVSVLEMNSVANMQWSSVCRFLTFAE